MSINIPDYRAAERTFQIITQVAGRAGRGDKQGEVLIQTYTPQHYSLQYAVNYDYEGFYEKEFTVRAMMKYPPFGKLLLINGTSKKEELLKNFMHKMAIRNIRTIGDDVLRKKCKEVVEITNRELTLIEDMVDTMFEANGVGLAAPQVGVLKRIFVIDIGDENGTMVFINPEILETKGTQCDEEGCLSIC